MVRFILIFIASLVIRLFFNFSQELIPGVNGGYYPLQVRCLLSNGHLAFSDMPLLFYLNAAILKVISFFGLSITDNLILNVVKLTDSISIPLLLLPLHKIIRLSNPSDLKSFESGILAFSVLSFSPLVLTSDLQKNALAIVFFFCSFACFLSFQNSKKKIDVFLSIAFLVFTGLTHFGTFILAFIYLFFVLVFTYRKKGMSLMAILLSIGLGIVFIIDISRFNRLRSFWTVIFEKPALLNGMLAPPDVLIILISISLAGIGTIILIRNIDHLKPFQKSLLLANTACLILFSFPFMDGEYFKRLSLFLFVPQILLLLQIAPFIHVGKLKAISISLFILTLLSLLAVSGHHKEAVLDKPAYEDLKQLNLVVKNDGKTIIIARHGLEWWAAWVLKTHVGQDKAIDNDLFRKYKNVIFIRQINGFRNEFDRTPFHEPAVPENSKIIFSSKYFKAFKLNTTR
ncbi:MAG: hypothetical protein RBS73_00835 [Prolixibacteraceae bacterium]|jgi:hypothetical protein|nr:hypothetical protein [Prolixibacteraceae bacterium]